MLYEVITDYAPAAELTAHLKELLDDPLTAKYSPDEGLPEVRQAVCDWYGRMYGAAPRPTELCLTIGASQAFWLAIMVLCRAGDEVVVQTPYYFDVITSYSIHYTKLYEMSLITARAAAGAQPLMRIRRTFIGMRGLTMREIWGMVRVSWRVPAMSRREKSLYSRVMLTGPKSIRYSYNFV